MGRVGFKFEELGYIGPSTTAYSIHLEIEAITGLSNSTRNLLLGINLFNSNDSLYPIKSPSACWYDREKFDTCPVGIPIEMVIRGTAIIFYMEGFFQSYEGCYSFLLQSNETRYKRAIQNLKILFDREYPDRTLKPAPDWRLLKSSGMGTMETKEFRANLFPVKKAGNVFFVPAVIEFAKIATQ